MAASSPYLPPAVPASLLQTLLATERDAHRRQRELVRASLVMCPGKREQANPAR